MTTTTVESIATVGDFYVPTLELRLRGRPVNKAVIRDVISVTYKDSIAEIDSFEVVINNWDAEGRTFKYSDDTLFDPGAEGRTSSALRQTARSAFNARGGRGRPLL